MGMRGAGGGEDDFDQRMGDIGVWGGEREQSVTSDVGSG